MRARGFPGGGRRRAAAAGVVTLLAVGGAAGCSSGPGSGAGTPAGASASAGAGPTGPARTLEAGPTAGHLHRTADGVVRLDTPAHGLVTAPRPGDPARVVLPGDPLPAPETGGRHVDVVYTPHPDDETLSLGVFVARAVERGDRVVLVALTDGRTTGAVRDVENELTRDAMPMPLDADRVAQARLEELRHAAGDLGVDPGDLYRARLDAPDGDGGPVVTVAEAERVERLFAARYPGATHVTMSDRAERQADHLAAGRALSDLVRAGVVSDAVHAVSRLWWGLPAPGAAWLVPTPQQRARVVRAADEYRLWDPAHGRYALGFFSVRWQFAALALDPRNRIEAPAPVR